MWMKSKSGMWHKMGEKNSGEVMGSCQSYNLDRPNPLSGESVITPPMGEKICKKCNSAAGRARKIKVWCRSCYGGVMHDRKNKPAKCGNCGKIEGLKVCQVS